MNQKSLPYRRVAICRELTGTSPDSSADDTACCKSRFRWIIIPLTGLLCIAQSMVTVLASNLASQYLTSTLITVIGFGFLFILVLACNPLIRFVGRGWIRPLGRIELMAIIAALMVSAGVSTFGLSDVLVPVIAAPWNPEWNTPQRGWEEQLHPYLRSELYITDPDAIRTFREGFGGQPPQGAAWAEWSRFQLSVARQLPWHLWVRPLAFWSIFVIGCYGMFWSLSYLVLDLWSRREKLIFPLAKLPESLLPDEGEQKSLLPGIIRHPLFWVGFAVSFFVLMYNAAAVADLIPLAKLNLGMGRPTFNALVSNSALSGLVGGGAFLIIFTCIGIAYLLPLDISFSVWFYFCMSRLLIYVMVQQGYGENFKDFPSDWTWTLNPISTLGMGGILFFSVFTLYRSVRNIVANTDGQNRRPRWPIFGLVTSFILVAGWLSWNHLPVGWAILVCAFLVLITVGLMRIVAESGVFWIQSNAGFFHLFKMLGLGNFVAPVLIAPLIPIYAILFFDIKTFIAPNVLHAAKLHDDVGGSRVRFHLNILVGLTTSVVASIVCSLVMAYGRGAQQMNSWFYSSGPRRYFEEATRASTMSFSFEPTTFAWFVTGGAWVGLTFLLRRSIFWFPHPVGFLMNINPLIQYMWFSFFIGWLIKKIVCKYGGQPSFTVIRFMMLGLIFGELLAVFLVGAFNLLLSDTQISGIDLNRYGP